MTTRTRTNRKTNVRLESLESREAPAVGSWGAWQAAFAQVQNPGARAPYLQGMLQTLRIARPGTTFQGPTPAPPDGTWYVNSTAGLPAGRAAPLAQAQAGRAARMFLSGGAATPRRAWMSASYLRFPTTTPATPVVTSPIPNAPTTPMTPTDQTSNAETSVQDLPPNVSGILNVIHKNFLSSSTLPDETGPGSIPIVGSNVGVEIHGNGQGDFSNFVGTLQNLGMEISATSDVTWTVVGMLPISQLPTAAQTPQTLSITPQYRPRMN